MKNKKDSVNWENDFATVLVQTYVNDPIVKEVFAMEAQNLIDFILSQEGADVGQGTDAYNKLTLARMYYESKLRHVGFLT